MQIRSQDASWESGPGAREYDALWKPQSGSRFWRREEVLGFQSFVLWWWPVDSRADLRGTHEGHRGLFPRTVLWMRSQREGVPQQEQEKAGNQALEHGHISEMGEEPHEWSGKRGSSGDIDCLGIPRGGGEFPEKGQPYLMLQRHSHQGEGTGLDK